MSQAYLRIFFKAIEKYWGDFLGWVCYCCRKIHEKRLGFLQQSWVTRWVFCEASFCGLKNVDSLVWLLEGSPKCSSSAARSSWRGSVTFKGVPVSAFGAAVVQKKVGGTEEGPRHVEVAFPRDQRVQLPCLRAPVGSSAPRERPRFPTRVIDELYVICKCECINLLNDSLIYVSL